jgi:hypothetical protein
LLNCFCSTEFKLLKMDLLKCIKTLSIWMKSHEKVYSEKCKICEQHLSFYSGIPMLPLVVNDNKYFHIGCFYDTKFT